MNRERDLTGPNGYDIEIGFQLVEFLRDKVAANGTARWLDLCCGTGKALTQAATVIELEPIEIVGADYRYHLRMWELMTRLALTTQNSR